MAFTRQQIAQAAKRAERRAAAARRVEVVNATRRAALAALGLPGETWRPVPNFPGYQASDHGRVRGTRVLVLMRRRGYLQVSLWRDGKAVKVGAGPIVLAAFRGGPPAGHVCKFRDGNPLNVALGNLYWAPRGMLPEKRAEVLAALAGGMRQADAAARFGLSTATIYDLVRWQRGSGAGVACPPRFRDKAQIEQQHARIVELSRRGLTLDEIAEHTGLSRTTVARVRRREGISRPRPALRGPHEEQTYATATA